VTSDGDPLYEITNGRPSLLPSVRAENVGARRVDELSSVTAVRPVSRRRQIQYWTFSGVKRAHDKLPPLLSYDLTFLSPEPIGWERPKTHGHAHAVPELYEVLEGQAGFFVQDLRPGPVAEFVALIEAKPGESVVIPPFAQHVTINRGDSMLVVADVIAKGAQHDYTNLREARGTAYYQRIDGGVTANPYYKRVPPLTRVSAADWSDAASDTPMYRELLERTDVFAWLTRRNGFADRFPRLAKRVGSAQRPADLPPATALPSQ
jgi:oxalate decarboxylase/phosphoglucose isomerase-like protein (cupin superfamily)